MNFVPDVWNEQLVRALRTPVPFALPKSEADVEAWRARQAADRARHEARHRELAVHPDDVVRSLAKLHAPAEATDHGAVCHGCDVDGYDAEAPVWPCRTWQLLDETAARPVRFESVEDAVERLVDSDPPPADLAARVIERRNDT